MNLALKAIQMQHGGRRMENIQQPEHLAEVRYQSILQEQAEFPWLVFNDGVTMKCRIFFPDGHQPGKGAPAVIFFHGGMWSLPNETEFVPWALQLESLGVVSIIPEFRMNSDYDVLGRDVLRDACEMMAWLKDNEYELGIDAERITVAGSDMGGLMALHVALPDVVKKRRFFHKSTPLPRGPVAVALFRGVTNLETREVSKIRRFFSPEELKSFNPMSRVQRGLPLLFISHGESDKLLSAQQSADFYKIWCKNKNQARLLLLDKADHAYLHFNVNASSFESTLSSWIRFMIDQGVWSEPEDKDAFLLL
ncbi:MAG: alpha/beta hydrolase [Akkermansia sp.]